MTQSEVQTDWAQTCAIRRMKTKLVFGQDKTTPELAMKVRRAITRYSRRNGCKSKGKLPYFRTATWAEAGWANIPNCEKQKKSRNWT